jgi:lysophospholipase L1-like esterase
MPTTNDRLITAFLVIMASMTSCDNDDLKRVAEIGADAVAERTLVVAAIGDSYASGEGNPFSSANAVGGVELWRNYHLPTAVGEMFEPNSTDARLCHTGINGTAIALEDIHEQWSEDPTAIVYQSFACSGASINRGLLAPQYPNLIPCNVMAEQGTAEPYLNCSKSQIDQAEDWLSELDSPVGDLDILVLNIGGNDIGFYNIVRTCLEPKNLIGQGCSHNDDVWELVVEGCSSANNPICEEAYNSAIVGLDVLGAHLARLNDAIANLLKPKHVLVVGYPDPLRDNDGNFCHSYNDGFTIVPNLHKSTLQSGELDGELNPGPFHGYFPFGGSLWNINHEDNRRVFTDVITPLNDKLREAADQHGWRFVDGWATATREHGYCSTDRWFNTPKDSWNKQGDLNGTAHPNDDGYVAAGELIADELREILEMSD